MSTDPAVSSRTESGRWRRRAATGLLSRFREARNTRGTSQRAFAKEQGVPRSTLQEWARRSQQLGLPPEAVAFFESPAGVAFLHRLVLALHLVMGWMGGGGIRLIGQVLELCGLSRVVATSYGVHQQTADQMQQALVAFGEEERARLARDMPPRKVTVVEDETFLSAGICLVAIEPVSGFLLAEEYADKRDTETWRATLQRGTEGLDVEVVQTTTDEARALVRQAKDLGAHHSPDLFHVDHEVNQAMALALVHREREARRVVEEATARVSHHIDARDTWESGKRGPGRPPNFARRIEEAQRAQGSAKDTLRHAARHREEYRQAVRNLGRLYHPYDLANGQKRAPDALNEVLETCFENLRRIAREARLSTQALSKINKAARLVPKMVDTLRFFHDSIEQRLEALELPPHHEELLRGRLVPAAYLSRCIGRERKAGQRAALDETLQGLLEDEAIAALSAEEASMLEKAAWDCADLFQRASSCVEGRNGRLSQWEHAQRRLSPKKLAGLTVVQNYFIRRPDKTTAAERFFGARPRDLFDYLLTRIPPPARPAARRENPAPQRLLQAA